MAVYCPPSYNEPLVVFNPSNWLCGVNNDGTITNNGVSLAYIEAHFLKFPTAQGNETLVSIDVLGNSQFNGALNEFTNTTDFNGTTNFNSNIKLNSGYLRFPNTTQQTTAMNTLTASSSYPIASITTDANGAINGLSNNTTPSVSSITYPDSTVQTTANSLINTGFSTTTVIGFVLLLGAVGSSSFQNFRYNFFGTTNLINQLSFSGLNTNAQWTVSLYNGGSGILTITNFTGCIQNFTGSYLIPSGGYIYMKISQKSFNGILYPYIETTYPLYLF